jgi:hypothetical protein
MFTLYMPTMTMRGGWVSSSHISSHVRKDPIAFFRFGIELLTTPPRMARKIK